MCLKLMTESLRVGGFRQQNTCVTITRTLHAYFPRNACQSAKDPTPSPKAQRIHDQSKAKDLLS